MKEGLGARILGWTEQTWFVRLLSLGIAAPTGAVLGLSALLVPAPAGHGTHLQLGLGSCSFLMLTDLPCPMCGATTTFTLMAHFRWIQALWTQPFAALLFLLACGLFALSLAEAIDPRARWSRVFDAIEVYEAKLAVGFLAFMGLAWVYKIWQMAGA